MAEIAAANAAMPVATATEVREPNAAEGDTADAVSPSVAEVTVAGAEPPAWPDDAVESAFLAEAKERGEPVVAPKPAEEAAEEDDPKAMPAIADLVGKIPPEVREALEDLFRAKFVRVVRVPKKALKV